VRTSDSTTRGIRIEVRSEFLAERSSPREEQYLFQYHVRISNVGTETAQLVSREWIITNADGEVERVQGPWCRRRKAGAAAGGAFEYTSFCPLKTPSAPCRAAIRWSRQTAHASTPHQCVHARRTRSLH
jgi:ApaG protein